MLNQFSDWLKIILQLANIVIIAYGLYKFLHKPHDTLAEEIKEIEKTQTEQSMVLREVKKELDNSFEKHRDQDRTNKVFKRVFILLANFEVAYCSETGYEHTDDLKQAKKELH